VNERKGKKKGLEGGVKGRNEREQEEGNRGIK